MGLLIILSRIMEAEVCLLRFMLIPYSLFGAIIINVHRKWILPIYPTWLPAMEALLYYFNSKMNPASMSPGCIVLLVEDILNGRDLRLQATRILMHVRKSGIFSKHIHCHLF